MPQIGLRRSESGAILLPDSRTSRDGKAQTMKNEPDLRSVEHQLAIIESACESIRAPQTDRIYIDPGLLRRLANRVEWWCAFEAARLAHAGNTPPDEIETRRRQLAEEQSDLDVVDVLLQRGKVSR